MDDAGIPVELDDDRAVAGVLSGSPSRQDGSPGHPGMEIAMYPTSSGSPRLA
jgi:hypothetical protein